MSARSLTLTSLLVALAITAQPAEAQLGGLARKARQKAAEATGVQSTDQPARMAGPEVTPESVDRFLLGLKTEATVTEQRAAAERRRQEQQAAERDAAARKEQCYEEKQKSDPAAPEFQRLQEEGKAAGDRRDSARLLQISQRMAILSQEMMGRVQAACGALSAAPAAPAAPPATPAQQAMQQGSGSAVDQGAQAAGMSATDYAQFKELVYTYLTGGKRAGLSDKEQQAIDAKKRELRERLKAVGIG